MLGESAYGEFAISENDEDLLTNRGAVLFVAGTRLAQQADDVGTEPTHIHHEFGIGAT